MKKTFTTIVYFLITAAAIAQIPNNGFETWTTVGTYSNPASWATLNNTTATYSIYTATKGTPGNPGTSYLKLTSRLAGPSVFNGIAVSGQLDTLTMQPKSGYAFTQRPASFTGKWQHMIYGSSQGSLRVLTTKWNTTTSQRDTIAYAEQTLAGMAMSWANFSMNLNYNDSINYPDSCMIVLQASGLNPTNNDYLWVDNLAFTGTVAVVQPSNNVSVKEFEKTGLELTLFPNPSSHLVHINLDVNPAQQAAIEMYDMTGKLVCKTLGKSGVTAEIMDVSGFSKGTYTIKLIVGQAIETRKLVIE